MVCIYHLKIKQWLLKWRKYSCVMHHFLEGKKKKTKMEEKIVHQSHSVPSEAWYRIYQLNPGSLECSNSCLRDSFPPLLFLCMMAADCDGKLKPRECALLRARTHALTHWNTHRTPSMLVLLGSGTQQSTQYCRSWCLDSVDIVVCVCSRGETGGDGHLY